MKTDLLKIVLKPIAKFCVRRSIKIQEFVDVFKYNLVVAAREELESKNEEVTGSRLSVMTGVHRKDIKKFLEGKKEQEQANVVTRIIGQWLQDKRFTTKSNKPRVLTVEGASSEFVDLVKSVSADLNPYTVLFELERIKAVKRTARGLSLQIDFYFPKGDKDAGYQLLANDLDDLIRSVEENIHDSLENNHLHLRTVYDKIPKDKIPQIKSWLLDEGSNFHERVRKYLSKHDADINKKNCSKNDEYAKISIGTFGYSKNDK